MSLEKAPAMRYYWLYVAHAAGKKHYLPDMLPARKTNKFCASLGVSMKLASYAENLVRTY